MKYIYLKHRLSSLIGPVILISDLIDVLEDSKVGDDSDGDLVIDELVEEFTKYKHGAIERSSDCEGVVTL